MSQWLCLTHLQRFLIISTDLRKIGRTSSPNWSKPTERDLIPFLTEFGAIQGGEQIREFVDLQFDQIESNLLDSTYWNYDLYNTVEGKDNWNLEDFLYLVLTEFLVI